MRLFILLLICMCLCACSSRPVPVDPGMDSGSSAQWVQKGDAGGADNGVADAKLEVDGEDSALVKAGKVVLAGVGVILIVALTVLSRIPAGAL